LASATELEGSKGEGGIGSSAKDVGCRGAVEWTLALSASREGLPERVLGVEDGSRNRSCSSLWRATRPRDDDVEARGSAEVGEWVSKSEGRRRAEVALARICIEGTAVWVTSREALRRRGKRDVNVERRRAVGRCSFSLGDAAAAGVCSCVAASRSDWLLSVDASDETARTGRGRLLLVLVRLPLGCESGFKKVADGAEAEAEAEGETA
jgi:hypothetical protein